MPQQLYRIRADFPVLGDNRLQVLEIEAINWPAALGRAARELKKLPIMHKRRISAASFVIERIGRAEDRPAADAHTQPTLPGAVPAAPADTPTGEPPAGDS